MEGKQVIPRDMETTPVQTDVLVIGAGLAGICAAIQAARLGLDVILAEKSLVLGGNSGPDAGVHPSGAHRFSCRGRQIFRLRAVYHQAGRCL